MKNKLGPDFLNHCIKFYNILNIMEHLLESGKVSHSYQTFEDYLESDPKHIVVYILYRHYGYRFPPRVSENLKLKREYVIRFIQYHPESILEYDDMAGGPLPIRHLLGKAKRDNIDAWDMIGKNDPEIKRISHTMKLKYPECKQDM